MRAKSVSLTEHTFSVVGHRLAAPRAAPQPSHLSCSPRPRCLYDASASPWPRDPASQMQGYAPAVRLPPRLFPPLPATPRTPFPTRVEFLFCRPPLPPTALVASPPPFTGARCVLRRRGVEVQGGGNGKQARQPGIFTRRLPLLFALADVRGPGLKALATAARRTVCASVWFVQPAPLARCSPLSRAIYWQSSSHNRDTSPHMHRSLSRSLSSPLPPPAAAPSSRLSAPPPLRSSWPGRLFFLFSFPAKTLMIIKSSTTRSPASSCFVSIVGCAVHALESSGIYTRWHRNTAVRWRGRRGGQQHDDQLMSDSKCAGAHEPPGCSACTTLLSRYLARTSQRKLSHKNRTKTEPQKTAAHTLCFPNVYTLFPPTVWPSALGKNTTLFRAAKSATCEEYRRETKTAYARCDGGGARCASAQKLTRVRVRGRYILQPAPQTTARAPEGVRAAF